MAKGKTASGFNFDIPKGNLDNYELVEVLGEMEENPLVISKVTNMLLGVEQKNKLKEHLREENGIVSSEKMGEELKDIFEQVNEAKNS